MQYLSYVAQNYITTQIKIPKFVPISFPIRKIVSQMSSIKADCLTIAQAAHILPDHLFITKTRPPVRLGFFQEFFHRSSSRRNEQWFARHSIAECNFSLRISSGLKNTPQRTTLTRHDRQFDICTKIYLFHEACRQKVSRGFGIMPIVATDSVRDFRVAFPPQIVHDRRTCCPVAFLRHYGFITLQW